MGNLWCNFIPCPGFFLINILSRGGLGGGGGGGLFAIIFIHRGVQLNNGIAQFGFLVQSEIECHSNNALEVLALHRVHNLDDSHA